MSGPRVINAADVRHLFGGKPSATPFNPSGGGSSLEPSPVRTPRAKPDPLEPIFAALWERYGTGQEPVREYTFFEGRKWRFDFAWPAALVAVECDGIAKQAGGGRHNTDADRDKLNNGAADGWRILRFSRAQLEDQPKYCAALVARALGEEI